MIITVDNAYFVFSPYLTVWEVLMSLVCHYFYVYLARVFPGSSAASVTKKILTDQLLCAPVMITSFFWSIGIMEGKSKEHLMQKYKKVRSFNPEPQLNDSFSRFGRH